MADRGSPATVLTLGRVRVARLDSTRCSLYLRCWAAAGRREAYLTDVVGGREQALVQRLSVVLRDVLLHLVRNVPVQPRRAALLDLPGKQGRQGWAGRVRVRVRDRVRVRVRVS